MLTDSCYSCERYISRRDSYRPILTTVWSNMGSRNEGGGGQPPRAHPWGGVALRLRKCEDQRVGVRVDAPMSGSCGGQDPGWARLASSFLRPGPGPPIIPCASACPSNPRGTSRSPTLPGPGSPSWWETPERSGRKERVLLELSQQSAPGTSLLRLSEHAGPWQPTAIVCLRPTPPWLSARERRRAPGRGPAACGAGASTAGRKLCGQGWSRAGGGPGGCGAGRCRGQGGRHGGGPGWRHGGPGVGGMGGLGGGGVGRGRGGAGCSDSSPVPGVAQGLHPHRPRGPWPQTGRSRAPVGASSAPRPLF